MFDTILIANRGEIACRLMETAQATGVRCVAVYSDADASARHVAMADQAVHIGGAAPADSYLRGDAIIAAAQAVGAQAIHPGYGFLSENPEFVEACEAAGITFIGPSASAIRAMGLKDAAKALMEEAGVPVVPGYHGDNQNADFLAEQAAKIGYPVLIKAVAGGGGKGMRLVETAEGFDAALQSARNEAQTAFGNPDVLIEKFITSPRHIEIQVFGDGESAVHLFERDCSLQRRHQKVIEEAPAPGMTKEVRDAMGAAAVRAAEAIEYKGAGTVEFIVDGSGPLRTDGFWFMEMNTRLQVEHPVTEAITGVDLVEWQLRVAAGETLPAQQEDLSITGHAFEARLYAEDVPKGFLPATGRLDHLAFSDHARGDTGVRTADEISPWYDPMIAKIITHGETRAVALAKMELALADTEVAGTVTNLEFLGALTRHAGFAAGQVDTGLIERDLDALTAMAEPSIAQWIAAGQAAMGLETPGQETGFALWAPLKQTLQLALGGEDVPLSVEIHAPDHQRWTKDDTAADLHWKQGRWFLADQPLPKAMAFDGRVNVFGRAAQVIDWPDPLMRDGDAGASGNVIEAPMPGLVTSVEVAGGQSVAQGDRLAVLEAMKMEHVLTAARDGVVAEVLVKAGAQVSAGDVLIQLEDEDAA